MNEISPTFADWYPDAATGGTKYWDGKRWTGDLRPRRKQFAATAKPDDWGLFLLGLSVPALPLLAGIAPDESVEKPVLWILVGIVILLAYVAFGIYLFRGQGPTTASIKKRIAAEEESARGRRRSANMASVAERFIGRGRRQQTAPPMPTENAAVHINAISSGEITRSLEKLQHLLYSGAITDAEYDASKAKLLGTHTPDDPFAQVAKLAELHRDGVLGDVEFAAAKARVLGL